MDGAAKTMPVSLGSLLSLAWPIIISRSTQTVIGVADGIMVGHLGSAALAATTLGAFNTYVVLILPMGTMFIVASFSSQLFGRGDLQGARRFGYYGLLLAVVAQVACIASIPLVPVVLRLLPYEANVIELMGVYLQVRLLCGGAAMGMEALANYYGGIGNTRLPMAANVFCMLLAIVFNWVFIKGHLGAPALGVTGAAVAAVLATWLAFLALLAVFLWHGRAVGALWPKLHLAEVKRMLRFGVPSGFNWFFEFFAFNVFLNVVVAGLGTVAAGAFGTVFNINSMSFMPAFGVASAGAILVGQSIGAGKKDDVPRIVRITLRTAAAWQGLVGLSYVLAPKLFMSPFAHGEPADAAALIEAGGRMLMLSAAWQLFDATVTTVAEALRAAGDTAFVLWSRLALAWGLFFPGSYVTVRVLGGTDVEAILWVVLYLGMLAGILWLRFRSGRWRELQLVEPHV